MKDRGGTASKILLMLNAEAKQFRLMENGEICYQPNPTNPLPGDVVARIRKGDDIYLPEITLAQSALPPDLDKDAITGHILTMVRQNITETLEQLYQLEQDTDTLPESVRGILKQLHESLGFVPRPQVEHLIAEIDSDGRYALRKKGVKLGPILVFLPQLGKPAAVRLRALLWTLWNGGELPANVPRDGSVSQLLDSENISLNYYRMIGYPVFGGRAIRADMLDRLVNEIYDTANDGKFQAQHKMAEWLGCTIPELYKILTDLGHRKIYDPAEQVETEAKETEPTSQTHSIEEEKSDADVSAVPPATDETGDKDADSGPAAALSRPELATFAIKRGKAADRMKKAAPRRGKENTKDSANLPHKRKDKKSSFHLKDKKKTEKRKENVIHAAAPEKNTEDSPFAVLKDLKIGK